jgi:hypothetical protein
VCTAIPLHSSPRRSHSPVWTPLGCGYRTSPAPEQGWISNLDLLDHSLNPFSGVIRQLSDDMRIVMFDRRGTGLSDPVTRGHRAMSA